ncbi:MgtC/SapB family protein [Natranaeroarchaeum aerophilus]|uniref:MgtC/SapB family protein n=1 Tax=Natranaeroarchaeum aerophilus TaxID=2917711 RepID=A0AAE3FQW4_9EURY|nr:MgtC/SapB family protein [Natranaeroarchaeum aerophilus]MCL9813455.1 MgtC/SapB family protein [Natranaeroarchaeum aerophilus]
MSSPLDSTVFRIALAAALGLFLGLEREWSQKSAGIRTFSLISLLGAVFVVLDQVALLVVGGVLVIAQGVLLAVEGLVEDNEEGLSLTTSVSMLVAYGVGALVASGFLIEGVTVAVLSSLLLVLKRELHDIAWGLSREELRSATEFAILAFVVYPLLPADPIDIDLGTTTVAFEPRVAWLMVVLVAGIGIVNYAVVETYGGRGIAVTGFFGGLASSAAVVGTMIDHVSQRPEATAYAVTAVLLANAAMALRNLGIAVVFTIDGGLLYGAIVPLGAIVIGSVLIALVVADWSGEVELELDNPFSLRNALAFGAVFTLVLLAGAVAEVELGRLGFYATAAATGLISSAGATASAVLLYRVGEISADTAVIAILLATAASVLVKVGLAAAGPNRAFAVQVAGWSAVLLAAAGGATAVVVLV